MRVQQLGKIDKLVKSMKDFINLTFRGISVMTWTTLQDLTRVCLDSQELVQMRVYHSYHAILKVSNQ